ncbi:MAG: histidine phosphatase family protein [Anaerolineales bacterium]|nr:histidine phosphatase family protein [Anaerolineales bacterium]
MKEIWFIRHAESEANAGLTSSDPGAIPLTEKGRQQAIRVSKIIPETPSLIVVSPYIRTQQTAQPTLKRFPEVGNQKWNIQEFTFLSPVVCQNTTASQRRPWVKEYWERNDPFYRHGEGAESFADLLLRVQDTFRRIEKIDIDFFLIFSHGQFIKTFILTLLVKSFEPTPSLMQKFEYFSRSVEIPNCGVIKLRFENKEPFISGVFTHGIQE